MKYTLAIFDMDGTILNTLDDLKDSLNVTLKALGYPERTLAEVRSFVGNGIGKLIERAVPAGLSIREKEKVLEMFTEYYGEHSQDKTRPYDGIVEAIAAIRQCGIKTAVVSNKINFAVKDLVKKFFDGLFDYSLGETPGLNRKPHPDMVNKVLQDLNIDKKDAVYIGDSDVDIMTAKNSSLPIIAVSWGFRDRDFIKEKGAEIIVDDPCELVDILTK